MKNPRIKDNYQDEIIVEINGPTTHKGNDMTRKLRKLHALNGGPVINTWVRFNRPSVPTQRSLKWHRPKAVTCRKPLDAGVMA